uniref:Folate receptor-like domain-containing protein n=1 Tax=Anolis carolinensis TaxID=28377 RepID=H9GUQ6_ANOCA
MNVIKRVTSLHAFYVLSRETSQSKATFYNLSLSSLCRYDACKNDFICVKNALTDWEIDERGENHCKNECISYRKMYANGTEMCETMWGVSLKVSDSNCLCLQMNEMDDNVIKIIKERSSNSSTTTSTTTKDDEELCHLQRDKIKQMEMTREEATGI